MKNIMNMIIACLSLVASIAFAETNDTIKYSLHKTYFQLAEKENPAQRKPKVDFVLLKDGSIAVLEYYDNKDIDDKFERAHRLYKLKNDKIEILAETSPKKAKEFRNSLGQLLFDAQKNKRSLSKSKVIKLCKNTPLYPGEIKLKSHRSGVEIIITRPGLINYQRFNNGTYNTHKLFFESEAILENVDESLIDKFQDTYYRTSSFRKKETEGFEINSIRGNNYKLIVSHERSNKPQSHEDRISIALNEDFQRMSAANPGTCYGALWDRYGIKDPDKFIELTGRYCGDAYRERAIKLIASLRKDGTLQSWQREYNTKEAKRKKLDKKGRKGEANTVFIDKDFGKVLAFTISKENVALVTSKRTLILISKKKTLRGTKALDIKPLVVTIDDNESIYIAGTDDNDQGVVCIYDQNLNLQGTIRHSQPIKNMLLPDKIIVDEVGNIFVLDQYTGEIYKFEKNKHDSTMK